jgi:membrane-associated protease RseP (regulator of RpoE activity)
MVLSRASSLAVAMAIVGATTAAAQRGGFAGGSQAGFGAAPSDGPRPLLFGFALECVSCRVTGRGGRALQPGAGRGALGIWHYDEYPRIADVMPGSAAEAAGIRAGDVLVSVDGRSLITDDGAQHFGELRAGDTPHLTLERNGKPVNVDLVLRRLMGRGGNGPIIGSPPASPPALVTQVDGVAVEVWSQGPVTQSRDSTGATILKIGNTVVRLAGDSPKSPGRGRGARGGASPPTN